MNFLTFQIKEIKMKKLILSALGFFLLLSFTACDPTETIDIPTVTIIAPVAVAKTNTMKVYVHYMPWFENKTTNNGSWGYHWTMKNCNPDVIDSTGRRQIASHYYPLIGPYASSDKDLIEYHLLLMKYSGIDGILIDWYGQWSYYDSKMILINSNAIIAACNKVGLEFAIVYEDRTIPGVLALSSSTDSISAAATDMSYVQHTYFSKSNYIKIDNKPLLMVFGPDCIKKPADWTEILSVFPIKPCFLSLYGFTPKVGTANSGGEYLWPWGDNISVDTKYQNASNNKLPLFMGGAWPGFHDYYKEGGAGSTLFYEDYANGTKWDGMLAKATANSVKYLQLVTWNDFGEGTMIEPTREFGYSYLTKLQSFVGASTDSVQLKNIYDMYTYRKQFRLDAVKQAKLDQAFYYFASMQDKKASDILNEVK